MQVALHEGRALGQRGEPRRGVERDVELARRTARLEGTDALEEIAGQVRLIDMTQEGALDIHVRHDAPRRDLVAVRQDHAGGPAALHDDLLDAAAGANLATRRPERGGERLGDRSHAAARKAPGADRAIHIAHRVMQEDIGRAGRHRPERGADDRGDGLIGLDDRMLEILVEKVADRHRPEADHVVQLHLGQAEHLLA